MDLSNKTMAVQSLLGSMGWDKVIGVGRIFSLTNNVREKACSSPHALFSRL
jgi:hypothetical protein